MFQLFDSWETVLGRSVFLWSKHWRSRIKCSLRKLYFLCVQCILKDRGVDRRWGHIHRLRVHSSQSLPPSPTEPLSQWFLSNRLFPPHLRPCSQSLKQSASEAVSRSVAVWLKHYLRGFAMLFLKRSDILSQLPPLPTGKLKMPQSPQATRFIYLHTYWVEERENERGAEREL